MKTKHLLTVFFLIALPFRLSAQYMEHHDSTEHKVQFPGETVFVHYNASLLFAGEYLYYKIYTLNTESGTLSGISKVAYLEIVGGDGYAVLKQKIFLDKGTGQGDLFIPTSVASGNYKLIGYTQWMANGKNTEFFRGDLALLNPYQGDQSGLDVASQTEKEGLSESFQGEPKREPVSDNLKMTVGQKTIGTRERVDVNLSNVNGNSMEGNYSVSVRKTDDFINFSKSKSSVLKSNISRAFVEDLEEEILLPELRGDLLVGRVNKIKGGPHFSSKAVAIHIPGENPKFKIARTNEDGVFYFNMEKEYSGNRMLVQVVGDTSNYNITLKQDPQIKHSSLNLNNFSINSSSEKRIIERSIHNQVENAYYGIKPDTIRENEGTKIFNSEDGIIFNLDEFTRFPTIRETFIEIINAARIANNNSGEPQFRVRPPDGAPDEGLKPLLLVDGLMIQDHNLLIDYPAQSVKSIRIIREKYFNGPAVFQGVISVETVEGNFYAQRPSSLVQDFEINQIQPVKKYFKQVYNQENKSNRIPDFRYQLAWIPDLNSKEANTIFWFFTSDIPGNYEISLEGFLEDGTPVSLKEYFTVNN